MAVAGTLGAAVGGWQANRRRAPVEADPRIPPSLSGMDWQLADQTGRTVVPADWVGRPTLVFFGFTWCPDVCPTTLLRIAGWLDELADKAEGVRVVLVSVDPQRDTPDVLGRYLTTVAPDVVGLTGTPDEVRAAADAFRVVIERVPQAAGGDAINHTASIFLYAADGGFAGIIDFHEEHNLAMLKIERLLQRGAEPRSEPSEGG